ncbi:C6 finger domain-containing protein [Colletotrichum sojae]|uniref:C6 finger domain-containing protein n=1 Tax=Colletotrichum sojae TaxID=2175907 RepID=A0A8H6MZ45_9PEZI|nr:C6 finger domain-containing protein [Colletotrichum sojae]
MVYCGKPSKGCSSCRGRKVKCDQREPGCGQCEKRQQECPGYRNLVDLMFRDESSHVIKKASKTKARGLAKTAKVFANVPGSGLDTSVSNELESCGSEPGIKPRSPRRQSIPPHGLKLITHDDSARSRQKQVPRLPPLSGYDHLREGSWSATTQPIPLYSLSPSDQERGTAFFFSRYVSIDENACHQNYDFIFDVWRPASMVPGRQVDGVMASMTAVGLAGLSALTRCPKTMDWARRSYGTALLLTNDALQDPSMAVKDTTMLSILILGTYEMLTGRTPQTVRAWQQHINGASALAKMRGLGQFQSTAGVRMFMMLTQTVLISCIQRNMPMPPALVELRDQLGVFSAPGDPNWRLSGPIYRVMQLRYDIKRGNIRQKDAIINRLVKLDQEFVDIISDLPESWMYRRVALSQFHPAVFDGFNCHVFPALTLAATWNGVRSIRILVHETIIGELFDCFRGHDILSWSEEAKLQLSRSVDMLDRLRDAILASVPQHFGIVSFKHAQSVTAAPAKRLPVRLVPSPTSAICTSSSPGFPATDSLPRSTTFNGPTLYDPAQAEGTDDAAERFMMLASASNTIVWPLYLLGVSSSCTQETRSYVVQRLQAIYQENGLVQAGGVANMIRNKAIGVPWADLPWDQMPQMRTTTEMTLV